MVLAPAVTAPIPVHRGPSAALEKGSPGLLCVLALQFAVFSRQLFLKIVRVEYSIAYRTDAVAEKGFKLSDRLHVGEWLWLTDDVSSTLQLLESDWAQEAGRLREQARKMQRGKEREELLQKARQAEIAANLSEWINSPG